MGEAMKSGVGLSFLVFSVVLSTGCRCEGDQTGPAATVAPERGADKSAGVQIITVSSSETNAVALIQKESGRAQANGRKLVVYVGAKWCEPCTYFHNAAAAGELDGTFPTMTLLEFDHDVHETALKEAGCVGKMIPLFARPTAEGRCSKERIEGAIKGPAAVPFITPKLKRLIGE